MWVDYIPYQGDYETKLRTMKFDHYEVPEAADAATDVLFCTTRCLSLAFDSSPHLKDTIDPITNNPICERTLPVYYD